MLYQLPINLYHILSSFKAKIHHPHTPINPPIIITSLHYFLCVYFSIKFALYYSINFFNIIHLNYFLDFNLYFTIHNFLLIHHNLFCFEYTLSAINYSLTYPLVNQNVKIINPIIIDRIQPVFNDLNPIHVTF